MGDTSGTGFTDLVERACRWKGAAVLIADDDVRLSGDEVLVRVRALGHALAAQGLGPGRRAAFLCASSCAHALAFLALTRIGAVACALHALETDARLAEVLDWLEADILFADHAHLERAHTLAAASAQAVRVIALTADPAAGGSAALIDAHRGRDHAGAVAGDAPALIILSSATTGAAKGVVHSHAGVVATALAGPFVYGVHSDADAVLVMMAPSFAAWLYTVVPLLAMRARIVFGGRFDPERFLTRLAAERITLAPLVPTAWRMVLAAAPARHDLSALAVAFYSGEPGTAALVDDLAALGAEVRTAYLAAESGCAAGVVATGATLRGAAKPAATGRPVPGGDVRILAPEGGIDDVLARGRVGEIALSGRSIASGYWRAEALSRTRFVDGWWRSGDLGRLDEDGDLFVQGRTDNLINSGGVKVHAEEVEAAIARHPGVVAVAVVGRRDPTWGERIEAHVVARDAALRAEEIIAYCRTHDLLAGPKLPKAVHFHARLPTGPTGKLLRRALRDH